MHKALIIALLTLGFATAVPANTICGADQDGSGAVDREDEFQPCTATSEGDVCPIDQQTCNAEVDGSYTCPSDPNQACVADSQPERVVQSCSMQRQIDLTESAGGSGQNAVTLLSRTGGRTEACGDNCVSYRLQMNGPPRPGGSCTGVVGEQRFRVNDPSSIEKVVLTSQNHYVSGVVRINNDQVYASPNVGNCSPYSYSGIQQPNRDVTAYFRTPGTEVRYWAGAAYTSYGGFDSVISFTFKGASCEVHNEWFTSGCATQENDASCRLKHEWRDGVQTLRDFQSTGQQPQPSTRTINDDGCTLEVTRDYWQVDREYECDDPDYTPQKVCSAHQCFDEEGVVGEQDPEVQDPMAPDNGDRDEFGACLSEMHFFPGESKRCRRSGVQTSYQDCCENDLGRLDDTTGKEGQSGQREYKDEASDVEFWKNQCDTEDQEAALLADSGYCVYVGQHCREKWDYVGCVQKQRTYCCFNSKLSRIIHEQGRPQLNTFSGYGSSKNPQCRGFTPEEFQSLDFSKINLSEYYGAMVHREQGEMEQQARDNAQKQYQ